MTILAPPSYVRFARSSFKLLTMTMQFQGALKAGGQTYLLPGTLWACEVSTPLLTPAEAAPWRAFLAELEGPAGRFYFGDPDRTTPLGPAGGAPKIAGADQTGSTLTIDGADANVAAWLKAGDYVAFDTPDGRRELKILTADANTDGTGAATLAIKPPIRVSPDDDADLIVAGATCVMQLVDDSQAAWESDKNKAATIAFSAVEAVLIG